MTTKYKFAGYTKIKKGVHKGKYAGQFGGPWTKEQIIVDKIGVDVEKLIEKRWKGKVCVGVDTADSNNMNIEVIFDR